MSTERTFQHLFNEHPARPSSQISSLPESRQHACISATAAQFWRTGTSPTLLVRCTCT